VQLLVEERENFQNHRETWGARVEHLQSLLDQPNANVGGELMVQCYTTHIFATTLINLYSVAPEAEGKGSRRDAGEAKRGCGG